MNIHIQTNSDRHAIFKILKNTCICPFFYNSNGGCQCTANVEHNAKMAPCAGNADKCVEYVLRRIFLKLFFSVIKYVKTLKKIFSTTDGDVFVLPIYLMMEFLYLV